MIRGALDAARARDHLLLITETDGEREAQSTLIHALLDRQVDAVIYAAMYTHYVSPPVELHGHRVVLLNCLAPGFDAPAVIPDEVDAGRTAAHTLLQSGRCEGIWAIWRPPGRPGRPGGNLRRERAHARHPGGAAEHGVQLDGVVECDWNSEDGYREVRRLFDGAVRVGALICSTDRVSFDAYQALAEYGLSVPDDVSVISFDDQDLASWLHPPPTLALPHYEMGHTAVELILSGGPLNPDVHRVAMPLRDRASVSPPNG